MFMLYVHQMFSDYSYSSACIHSSICLLRIIFLVSFSVFARKRRKARANRDFSIPECRQLLHVSSAAMPNARQDYSYLDDWKRLWEPDVEAIVYNGSTCDPTRVDPKVLDWIKEQCLDKPHFVKVINRNAAHGQPGLLARSSPCIAVPTPFVQEHFRDLDRVITLDNGEGRKWKVSFASATRHPLWLQGWKRFARDNDLKPGDVVVFELKENSHFRFTIFDEDGNISTSTHHDADVKRELSYSPRSQQQPSATESDEIPRTNKRVISSDSDTEAEEEFEKEADPPLSDHHGQLQAMTDQAPATPCKRRRLQKLSDIGKVQTMNADTQMEERENLTPENLNVPNVRSDCGGSGVDSRQGTKSPFDPLNPLAVTILSKRRTVTSVERQRARVLADAHAQTVTKSPNFLVVMTDDQVYGVFHLILPERFVADAGLPTSSTRVTLVDCTGKTWEVHGRENVKFQVQFYRKSWALFALQHLLEEGDVCVFELTCRKARTILVRIFRVVPIPMVGRSLVHDHYELRMKGPEVMTK